MRTIDKTREALLSAFDNKNTNSIIVPMPFQLEVCNNIKYLGRINNLSLSRESEVIRSFSTISDPVLRLLPQLNKYGVAIVTYIALTIKYNSNIIKFNIENIKGYMQSDISNRLPYFDALNILIDYNIIAKTNIQGVYNVNPLAILKGNINTFYNYYTTIRNAGKEIRLDGKTIIDKAAIITKDNKLITIGNIIKDVIEDSKIEIE